MRGRAKRNLVPQERRLNLRVRWKRHFNFLPVRRPILSVSRLVDKGVPVVMGNDRGNKLGKNGRVIHLHTSNGVYHVRATALSEPCPLEE